MILYHLCYSAKFGHFRSHLTSVINEDPPENVDPSRPAFQGHSRSLELTRIDRQHLPISDP